MDDRKTIGVKEAARLLGISTRKVYSMLKAGELDGYSVGRRKVIFADSIPAYQERHRFQTTNPLPGESAPQRVPGDKGSRKPIPGFRHLRL